MGWLILMSIISLVVHFSEFNVGGKGFELRKQGAFEPFLVRVRNFENRIHIFIFHPVYSSKEKFLEIFLFPSHFFMLPIVEGNIFGIVGPNRG